jgi:hypothetical protein
MKIEYIFEHIKGSEDIVKKIRRCLRCLKMAIWYLGIVGTRDGHKNYKDFVDFNFIIHPFMQLLRSNTKYFDFIIKKHSY